MPAARILVVDDEEWNRDLCSRRLERSGFLVRSASSGLAAFQALERNQYDLLLLDHMMPEMSGFEVLKRLRQGDGSEDLAIIMLTAETSGTKIAEALEAGADDYITKPVDYPAALARIRAQLARRQEARELRHREARLSLASQSTPGGLWEWDFRTGVVYYAPQWKWMLGYEDESIGCEPNEWKNRIHADDRSAFQEALECHLTGKTSVLDCEQRMRMRDGSYRSMSVRGMSERDADGEPLRMAGVMLDIHDRTMLDPLTGLLNRATWMERLHREPKAGAASPFAILLLNLDGFKAVNESFGHAAGDQVLVETGRRLREVCAASEKMHAAATMILARTDSDDFAVLVNWQGDSETREARSRTIENLVEQMMGAVRRPYLVDSQQVLCVSSLGVAIHDENCQRVHIDSQVLLREAADALRTAKSQGRDRWVRYDQSMVPAIRKQVLLENDLRRALHNDEIVVFYQPRVRIADGVICGFEALARWRHSERGIIAPSEFIPIAESTGMIVDLGKTVLRKACRQLAAWQENFPEYPGLDVAVNLSVRQCQEPDVVDGIASILAEAGLAPGSLHLELTESMLLGNFEEARKVLLALKDLGVGLKIDDFGTGYSSLRYLGELPFDTLKIDRCFILALGGEHDAAEEMVRMILTMATNLHLEVIAEGVEGTQQLAELQKLGCRYAQGFYFSRPVEAKQVEQLLHGPFSEGSSEALDDCGTLVSRRFAAWDNWNHRQAAFN